MRTRMVRVMMTAAVVAATALLGLAAPAGATPGNQQLEGVGVPDLEGACTDIAVPAFVMSGSLEGCWYFVDFEVVQETPSGVYQERGNETFVGCLMDDGVEVACGTFDTTYKFSAKFAPDGQEIHGRCQHPIESGTDGFAGLTGRVDFKDDIEAGTFPFRGHIALG